MPNRRDPLYTLNFWIPLTEDVEDLLVRFQHKDSVRYEDFSAIWREMAFSDVFRGTVANNEMRRFCQVALATAYKYFVPPYSYQIQVGGLYLMYAFYNTQLAAPTVKIRLPMYAWQHVQDFLEVSVNSGHYDVVYILRKLIATKALYYTAMPHFLTYRNKSPKEPVCHGFIGRSKKVQELISNEMLEEMTNIHTQYNQLKKTVVEKGNFIPVAHQDFPARLHDCVLEFHTWQKGIDGRKDENSTDKNHDSSKKAQLLASIKSKSYSTYKTASKSRRHRKVEMAVVSTSGTEHTEEEAASFRSQRRPSLRARTCKRFGTSGSTPKSRHPFLLGTSERDKRVLNMALKTASQQTQPPLS